ncbi:MAG: HAD family hydrolase [Promethearchaeota archaeon]
MQKFEFVFWDFDGTLFDTYPHIASIIIKTMKSEYNLDLNMKNIEKWAKISVHYCFDKISSKFNIDNKDLQNQFSKRYMTNIESKQLPFPGAKEMIEYIYNRGGKNFIVTHRRSTSLSRLLKYNNLEHFFEKLLTYDDNFPRKPDPSAFLFLINEYNLPKKKILAIGDREIDIQTAKSIDVISCYFNPEGKTNEIADFNIKTLLELKKIINL